MRPPQRNLPPDAEMWGRWVETEIAALSSASNSLVQRVDGAFSSIGSTNNCLTDLVQTQIKTHIASASGEGPVGIPLDNVEVELGNVTIPVPAWAKSYVAVVSGRTDVLVRTTYPVDLNSLAKSTITLSGQSQYVMGTPFAASGVGPPVVHTTHYLCAVPTLVVSGPIPERRTLTSSITATKLAGENTTAAENWSLSLVVLFLRDGVDS